MQTIRWTAVIAVLAGLGLATGPECLDAASIATYTASDDPGLAPDANAGADDAWTVTATDIGTGGAGSYLHGDHGWTIWTSPFGGDPATQTDAMQADHALAGGALEVGQGVSIGFGNREVLTDRSVGVSLTSGGTPVVTLKFTGGDPDGVYRYDDAGGDEQDTGQPYQFEAPAPFIVSLDSATTYSASYNGAAWSGTYGGAIDGVRVFNDRAGDNSDTFFNNLAIVPEPSAALLALAAVGLAPRRRARG